MRGKNYYKKVLKGLNSLTKKNAYLNYYLYKLPYNLSFRFADEQKIEKGINISTSNVQSVVLFTVHKCASVYTYRLITSALADNKAVHIDYDSYFSETLPSKYKQFESEKFLKNSFKKQGYFFGPFRSFRKIPEISSYKVVLILRDPRDVLTSQYFSFGFSHKLINPKMIKNRKEVSQINIDDYVLEASKEYKIIYQDYLKLKKSNSDILFLKYEDMISEFTPWLSELYNFLGISTKNNFSFEKSIKESSFKVEKENIHSHIRNIKSGDHINKLKKETIEKLDLIFDEELRYFNYK